MVALVDHLHLGLFFIVLFSFQEIFVAPIVFLAFMKMFSIAIKFTLLEDKPFPFGTLCHCEKCIEFGLFVWTLLFLGVLYLIPSYMLYLLEWDKSLSMCDFIHLLCSTVFSSLVELCWIDPLLILFFDIFWTSNVFWQTFYSLLNLLVFCPKYVFFGSWKYCACMFTKCISYTILCFVWSII